MLAVSALYQSSMLLQTLQPFLCTAPGPWLQTHFPHCHQTRVLQITTDQGRLPPTQKLLLLDPRSVPSKRGGGPHSMIWRTFGLWQHKGKWREEQVLEMNGLHAQLGLQHCYGPEYFCAKKKKKLHWLMILLHVYFSLVFCCATLHWQMCLQHLGCKPSTFYPC